MEVKTVKWGEVITLDERCNTTTRSTWLNEKNALTADRGNEECWKADSSNRRVELKCRGEMKKIFTCCLILMCSVVMGQAPALLSTFGLNNDSTEMMNASVVDNQGNIIVAITLTDTNYYERMSLLKYDQDGGLIWRRNFDGITGSHYARTIDVKTDAMGNIYALGMSKDSISTLACLFKYDPAGNVKWMRALRDSGNYAIYDMGLAIDNSSGFIYVAGQMAGDHLCLHKLTSHGSVEWSRGYTDAGGWDRWVMKTIIRIDDGGNILLAGSLNKPGAQTWQSCNVAVMKYSSSGDLQWVRMDHGSRQYIDFADDMEVDLQGNVYVTGLENYTGEQCNAATLKYDPNGNLLWKQVYNNEENGGDEHFDLLLSHDGNVYVTGAEDRISHWGYSGSTTIKYDSHGNRLWKISVGDTSRRFVARHMQEDTEGNIYMTGNYTFRLYQPSYSYAKMFTAKLSPGGTMQWIDTCDTQGATAGVAMLISPSGSVHVVAQLTDTSEFNIYYSSAFGLFRYAASTVSAGDIDEAGNMFVLYPNPSQGEIVVSGIREETCMEIIDLAGRKVACVKLAAAQQPVDVSYLPAGSYTLRAVTKENIYTKKMLLVK